MQTQLQAPAGDRPVKIDPAGETVLPNGRLITPRGAQVKVAPYPYGLALSPDGNTLVTANSGTAPFSLSIMMELQSREPWLSQGKSVVWRGSKPTLTAKPRQLRKRIFSMT